MTDVMKKDPGIAFLGVCERAAYVREGSTNLYKWNILGLKQIVLSHLFPIPLRDVWMGWAFYGASAAGEHKFQLIDESGKEIGTINITSQSVSIQQQEDIGILDGPNLLVPEHGWLTAFIKLGDSPIVVEKPGLYHLRLLSDDGPKNVGQIIFAVVDPPTLTPDRISAIRSDPNATKAVRLELGCKHCATKGKVYTALDRSEKNEAEGWTWYQDLPERFTCECGKTNFDLSTIRRNLHGFLGRRRRDSEQVQFIPLYEKSSLETVRSSFMSLLNVKCREEQLQKFIEENPNPSSSVSRRAPFPQTSHSHIFRGRLRPRHAPAKSCC